MEHHYTASKLAKFGRNGDSMLVHMTPHEVAGLQYLAMSHGGSLTINPHTGLVEAFSLGGLFKSFLPMLIGGALTVFSGGALSPVAAAMMTGAGFGVAKGDWKQGLMAGLGAFGGANLAGSLAGMGANAAKTAATAGMQGAGTSGITAGQAAALNLPESAIAGAGAGASGLTAAQAAALNLPGAAGQAAASTAAQEAVKQGSMQALGKTALQNAASNSARMSLLGEGAKQAFTSTTGLGTLGSTMGMKTAMAAAAPTLDAMSQPPTFKPGKEAEPMFYNTSYNPGTYDPAKREFVGAGFGPGTWSKIYPGMPGSTTPTSESSAAGKPNSLTAAGLKLNPNYGQPGEPQFIPAMAAGGMTPTGYGPSIDAFTGEENGFAAGGLSSLPEYKAGGKLLNGPGDGMSDSIPAVIQGQKPQRAALADGEFVVPADVVSHLGNGSTKAGANQLYAMMDKVRQARTGSKKQGTQINPARFVPA